MGGLRKLRRKGFDTYAVEPLHVRSGPRGEKLSAVILEFARPLTEHVDDRGFRGAIGLAVFCWDIALLPEEEQERERHHMVKKMAKNNPDIADELETWSKYLLDRKKALFADDRRMVVEHTVRDEGDSHHLYVVSTPIPDPSKLSRDDNGKS